MAHMSFRHNTQIICAAMQWKENTTDLSTASCNNATMVRVELAAWFFKLSSPVFHSIVYEMASTTKPISLNGGLESLGNVAPTIGDNSKEVHRLFEQIALLHSKPSNVYTYITTQQLGNFLRRGEIRSVIIAYKEYTHLDGQLSHRAPYTSPNTTCHNSQ